MQTQKYNPFWPQKVMNPYLSLLPKDGGDPLYTKQQRIPPSHLAFTFYNLPLEYYLKLICRACCSWSLEGISAAGRVRH